MSVLTLESLAKRVTELEREVKLARGQAAGSLNVSANQQGPLPGWLAAGQFGPGVTQKASLHIKNDANQVGSSPRLTVNDPNGTTRVELGNLAALGNSPAQWGLRANDASNNPIFDSLGLIAAASVLATDAPTPGSSSGSGTGWGTKQTIPNSGTDFTINRNGSKILCISTVSVDMSAGATNYCSLWHGIWNGSGGAGGLSSRQLIGAAQFGQNVNWYITGATIFTGLNAGTYQVRQEFALDAGTTAVGFGIGATGVGPRLNVIQLGG